MTFSQFVRHFLANQHSIPAAVATVIRREALARVTRRQAAGRADGVLLFDDLILRIESAVAPKAA